MICFARTIIRQSKIVILDDPTGGLDTQTKNIIYKNIKKYLKDKTVIIVTNQEDLMKLCDKIIVVDNGIILEDSDSFEHLKDRVEFLAGAREVHGLFWTPDEAYINDGK